MVSSRKARSKVVAEGAPCAHVVADLVKSFKFPSLAILDCKRDEFLNSTFMDFITPTMV